MGLSFQLFSSTFAVMTFAIEIEQEKDGRWIAEIPQIPGAMVYGQTREQAVSRVEALALSQWGSAKARKVLAALLRIGWTIKREFRGSHRISLASWVGRYRVRVS